MPKLEQVSSDRHQISLAGGSHVSRQEKRVPMLHVQGAGGPVQWGPMYDGKWSHGHPVPCRQTD